MLKGREAEKSKEKATKDASVKVLHGRVYTCVSFNKKHVQMIKS